MDCEVCGDCSLCGCEALCDDGAAVDATGSGWVPEWPGIGKDVLCVTLVRLQPILGGMGD